MRSSVSQPLVLVIEDDENARDIVSTILRHHGYQVHAANDGVEIVEVARELMPAVVLMDLSMPRVDGWTALKRLRSDRDTAGIPVVALTAHSMRGDQQKTADAGFDSYLSKPLDPHAVLDEVRRLIGMTST